MSDDTQEMVISEVLCYIQNKMNTTEHDIMIKAVVSYYRDDVIHEAKILLFEHCRDTKARLITYKIDTAKKDCIDIINKFNEVGTPCPLFVAANLANVPLTTADGFDLAKLSMNLETMLKLENRISSSFETLSCLQSDFSSVLQKCSKIDVLADELSALKTMIAGNQSIVPLPHSDEVIQIADPKSDQSDGQSDSHEDASSCDGDVESAAEDEPVRSAQPKEAQPKVAQPKEVHPKDVQPKEASVEVEHQRMTSGGFTYVEAARKPAADRKHARVFTNSSLRSTQQKFSLKTVNRRGSNESRNHSSVYVSNFTPDTKPEHVASYLHNKYHCNFNVVSIPSKFKDCSSFKVVVQPSLKSALLNRENWAPNVYVREFYETPRNLASLAKY